MPCTLKFMPEILGSQRLNYEGEVERNEVEGEGVGRGGRRSLTIMKHLKSREGFFLEYFFQ